MRFHIFFCVAVMATAVTAACSGTGGTSHDSRDFVRAVGSSTVYPFAMAIGEHVTGSGQKPPVTESIGTGAGMRLFCAGVGVDSPDIVNASRRIKVSEYHQCVNNGVTDIVELQVGIDGIAFAEAGNGPRMALTPEDIYKALAAKPFGEPNTARLWSDVNPGLPSIPILVYGPPATSGTRDALAELILEKGCLTRTAMTEIRVTDPKTFDQVCHELRDDGAYVDAGENDNLIVQKVAQDPNAIGVFGFSFLEENKDKLKGVSLGGVKPTYEAISDFSYPGARPLYIYIKKAHLDIVKPLNDYVTEWTKAWGEDGYLKEKGMVIAPERVRMENAGIAKNMTILDPQMLDPMQLQ